MARYLVTGASGGMGQAICRTLSEKGHEVIGLDLYEPKKKAPFSFLRADVTDAASLEAALARIADGRLDGVIHAAGLYDLDSLVEIDEERFLRIFNVNLFGVYRVNKLALPLLAPGARVVIITSELAPLAPLPFTGLYAITKAALDKYADSLRMELQLLGCQVVVIRPGAVRTGMLPASVAALDRFCAGTRLYPVNAARFRSIVGRAEARNVPPEALARKVLSALTARRPRLVYRLNRNPFLRLLNALPRRWQLGIIRKILS